MVVHMRRFLLSGLPFVILLEHVVARFFLRILVSAFNVVGVSIVDE